MQNRIEQAQGQLVRRWAVEQIFGVAQAGAMTTDLSFADVTKHAEKLAQYVLNGPKED